ncbi:MAG: succinate dehydrogenase/fumarate reductase cytochrome b subunit [Bacteroidaceae bacterium]|nr:succinate dehydrogenase/fumarate reductase cytochrome b subunit [Bacteroidaceae bacterium]
MWLIDSSIGRKVVMSVTGGALILFLTFHMAMNCAALFSGEAYNAICEFLGANWYALVGTVGLAVLVVLHFVYAFWLTIQNRKARGTERYAVTEKPQTVEWASQNMLVLGIIVALGLCLHLFNFWSKMQLQEIIHGTNFVPGQESATDGAALIAYTFSKWYYVLLYIVWLAALWFHLSHGFWSALQTLGWSGKTWLKRWQVIGNIYVTLLVLGFISVVLMYFFKGLC